MVTLGDLLSLVSGAGDDSEFGIRHSALKEGVPLSLLRGPATVASGRLGAVAGQPAFEVETVG